MRGEGLGARGSGFAAGGFLFLGGVVLLEELAAFDGEAFGGGFGFGEGFAPGLGAQGEAGGLAVFDHGAARVGEVAGEERAFALHLFGGIGGSADAGLEVGAFGLVEPGAAGGGEASVGVFAGGGHGFRSFGGSFLCGGFRGLCVGFGGGFLGGRRLFRGGHADHLPCIEAFSRPGV